MAQAIQPISLPMITEANQALAADTARIVRLGTPPTMGKGGDVPLSESFMSSLYSLAANVTRTILTMLGIIIGVVAKSFAALEANGSIVLRSLRHLAQAHTFLPRRRAFSRGKIANKWAHESQAESGNGRWLPADRILAVVC